MLHALKINKTIFYIRHPTSEINKLNHE